ncbi:MAG: tRNA threonylcarbamoyladenosine dehydratase [Magnetococcales bacterium]|nr:tRNA threonylcarbamoyladenosine dehydratase [Magnetococcales bacterium]
MNPSALFERTSILLGDAGLHRLNQTHVLVAGLGGVGSYAAEALARAGIGQLTLVDSDVVAPSNLNRQLHAMQSTIGKKKVDLMVDRIQDINPNCVLNPREIFLTTETIPNFLDAVQPDWVADGIDSLNCKVSLLIESLNRHYPVISSMGAGGRLDPTQIKVNDLMDTHSCPLAREVRKRLRRRGGDRGVTAIWTTEPALPPLPPEPTSQGRPRAVNGTISYLPALFGLTMAGMIIQSILNPKADTQ